MLAGDYAFHVFHSFVDLFDGLIGQKGDLLGYSSSVESGQCDSVLSVNSGLSDSFFGGFSSLRQPLLGFYNQLLLTDFATLNEARLGFNNRLLFTGFASLCDLRIPSFLSDELMILPVRERNCRTIVMLFYKFNF